MGSIEIIGHLARVLSLSLRLFGNIFGEEMVVLILGSLIPFLVPLPIMVLGIVTGTLQAFIFVLLTMIYLAAAVHTEHDHDEHHNEANCARGGMRRAVRQRNGQVRNCKHYGG